MENNLPEEVKTSLNEIIKHLTNCLKDQLVGVQLFGSASYCAYEPGFSDLDVQAVVKYPLETIDKEALICRLNQDALPCPATKLEFVIYAQSSVHPASRHPRCELNLYTGPHQSDHVSLDPANERSHCFLFDIAMGRQLGLCLYGSALVKAFGAIPCRWISEAMADSLDQHQANEVNSASSVLKPCRSWQFIVTGEFSSKSNGAKCAMKQQDCPAIVECALAARKTGDKFPATDVKTLYKIVVKTNRTNIETDMD